MNQAQSFYLLPFWRYRGSQNFKMGHVT